MKHNPIFFVLASIFTLIIVACNKPTIVGKWRPIMQQSGKEEMGTTGGVPGIMSFYADSTFYFQATPQSLVNTTPGWHVGSSVNGKFRTETNHIYLHFSNKEYEFTLPFEIIQINNKELVLKSTILGTEQRYSRVEFVD